MPIRHRNAHAQYTDQKSGAWSHFNPLTKSHFERLVENNMRQILQASLILLLVSFAAIGQQTSTQPQPLTFYYDYKVNPGKEEEFMNLIRAKY